MKIVYIITRADHYGGAQIHVRELSKWMKNHAQEVHVIAGTTGILSDEIIENGIHFHHIPPLVRSINPIKDIACFFQLHKTLMAINPDIISCHSSKAGLIGRIVARSLGIKSIFTAHGWSFTDGITPAKKHVYRILETIAAWFGDHIITVSRYDKILALQYHVAKSKNMTVVHNGKHFLPAPDTKHSNDVPQLCMVARFSAQKDHTTLLNALGALKDKPWHLNLIGDGDTTPYKAMAMAFGIEDKITFHGQRSDIPQYLETQDIYLLISHWEGFPRSIIEAMRASLPVITTRTAGSPEAVSNFKSGYVVPKKSPKALARAINLLLSDPLRRHTMGEMGRKRYEKYFTFDDMAYRTLNVYETVLDRALTQRNDAQPQYHPQSVTG